MKVAIIGGGITGMSLGFYLARAGHRVTVYEKEDELGGLAGSFPIGKTFLEKYYHHIFLTDAYTIALIKELGLEAKISWQESKMGMYCEGRLYPFGTPLDLLKFKPLSFIDKVRFSLSTLYLVKTEDYRKLERVTAEEFLLKTAGPNVYKKIWEPLLAAKFGDEDYKKATASWFHARVSSRGRSKKSIFEREKLGYLDGSLKVLFDELQKRIIEASGIINKGMVVERIDLDKNGRVLVRSNNSREIFDRCCLCVSNPIIVRIAGHLFSREYITARLESIKYRAVLCVVLIIKGSLGPYYWININQRGVPFTGLIEHTNLISKTRYGENDVIYLGRCILPNEAEYNMKDEELIDFYAGHVKELFPEFDRLRIKQGFVFRDLYAQPVYTLGYKQKMPSAVSPIKNIFINNTSQTYPEPRGMSPIIGNSLKLSKIMDKGK